MNLLRNTTKYLDNERWIMSYYRASEISGALFFGRLAAILPANEIQADLTQHFADESMHASLWTKALHELGHKTQRVSSTYQDHYLEAAGLPVNLMEILALTNVFERRVISQYALHLKLPHIHPVVHATLKKIMEDERWHIHWIEQALKKMEAEFGSDTIKRRIDHYREADREIFGKVTQENKDRLQYFYQLESGASATLDQRGICT